MATIVPPQTLCDVLESHQATLAKSPSNSRISWFIEEILKNYDWKEELLSTDSEASAALSRVIKGSIIGAPEHYRLDASETMECLQYLRAEGFEFNIKELQAELRNDPSNGPVGLTQLLNHF